MPWNPEIYNQFKEIRFKPFFDLIHLINDTHSGKAVDLGCGTGEQTAILARQFQHTTFLGLDTSAEMLHDAQQQENTRLRFEQSSIEDFAQAPGQWDLIFSNAALQWADNHRDLFPQIIAKLNTGGQLAVQMPMQTANSLNILLDKLVQEKPFCDYWKGHRRRSPLLDVDGYAKILFAGGLEDIQIMLKVYPIIARSEEDLFQFISGSALIPYQDQMGATERELFHLVFKKRIKDHFQHFPAMYPFKRLLLYGKKA